MADEFFADLLPLKPKVASQTSPSLSKSDQRSTQGNYGSEVGSDKLAAPSHAVGDLLGSGAPAEIPEDFASGKGPVSPPADNDNLVKLVEAVVQKSLHKFAEALQPVLLSMTRQLDGVTSKVDQMSGALHASQTGSKQNDTILEHLLSLERSLKDLKESVESVSQRQEKAELAAKEAAKSPIQPAPQPKSDTSTVQKDTKAAADVMSPATSLQPAPSAVLPPGPALPGPTLLPVPATAPPATPREQPPTPTAQPPAPAQAAQALQQYGSTASQQSFSPYPSQPSAQQQQAQQGSQHQYAAPPQQQSPYTPPVPQQGYPGPQQAPQAPPTPPTYTPPPPAPQPPSQSYHSRPPQQASQQYSGPYGQPQQPQAPANLYYNSRPQESNYRPAQDASPYAGSYGDGSSNRQGYPNSQGYPSVNQGPQNQRYGGGSSGQSYAPPPPHSKPPHGRAQGPPAPQHMPLEQVVDDIANMGFSRHEARSVIQELQDKGQAVDLNVVLDRLMNGPRR